MMDWTDRTTWPFVPPGYYAVPEIFEAIGKKIFADEWTGAEANATEVDPLPIADRVFGPGGVGFADEGYPNEGELYFRYCVRAGKLLDVDLLARGRLSWDEWQRAYDLSLTEVSEAETIRRRQHQTLASMQRLAASGILEFEMADQTNGYMSLIKPHIWNCQPEVAFPRFYHGALSDNINLAMAQPPSGEEALKRYDRTFVIPIFVGEASIIKTLSAIYFEPFPEEGPTVSFAQTRVDDLLKAAAARNISHDNDKPASARVESTSDVQTPPPSVPAPVTTEAVLAIVRECVEKRFGVDPTRAAIISRLQRPITRDRARLLHSETWFEVWSERPTRGANSRA